MPQEGLGEEEQWFLIWGRGEGRPFLRGGEQRGRASSHTELLGSIEVGGSLLSQFNILPTSG